MTKVTICGIYELRDVCQRENPDLIISITDPGSDGLPQDALPDYPGKVVRLGFHDIDRVTRGYVAPSLQDAQKLKNFLASECPETPEHLLVHCHLGMSRSPAMAMLALAMLQSRTEVVSPEMADRIVEQVFSAAPHARPNERILKAAEHMVPGLGRRLVTGSREAVAFADATNKAVPFTW